MQLLYMLVGCATHVYVYDFTTKEPITDAFVYVNEYKMFNPFNSSNIYLTDKDGCVDISTRRTSFNIYRERRISS